VETVKKGLRSAVSIGFTIDYEVMKDGGWRIAMVGVN
jgi:hypothetical protein